MKNLLSKITLLIAGFALASSINLDAAKKLNIPTPATGSVQPAPSPAYTPKATPTPMPAVKPAPVSEAQVESVVDQAMKKAEAQQNATTAQVAGEKLSWFQRAKNHIKSNWEKYAVGGVATGALTILGTLYLTEKKSKKESDDILLKSVYPDLLEKAKTDRLNAKERTTFNMIQQKFGKTPVKPFHGPAKAPEGYLEAEAEAEAEAKAKVSEAEEKARGMGLTYEEYMEHTSPF